MSFYKKYELDRLMADGEAKSFRAVETATGRVVFLHLFNPSGRPLLETLKAKLGGKGKPLPPLIELGEFAGSQYAVTQAIEPFGNLRDWIAAHVATPAPLVDEDSSPSLAPRVEDTPVPPPPAPRPLLDDGLGEFGAQFPSAPAAPSVGDFTAQFQQPKSAPPPVSGGLGFGELSDPFLQPKVVPPPAAPKPPEAGEFTRMFEPSKPAAPPLPPSGPPAQELGEFTRMFQPAEPVRPSAPPPPPLPPLPLVQPEPPASAGRSMWAPPPPPTSEETGQFTRLFGSRMPGEAIDIEKEHASASQSAQPENRPFQAASEFTRMFGPQGVPGASAPPEAPAPSINTSGRLTSASGMFGEPEDLARFSKQVLSSGKSPGDAAVPGEYTRMFDNPRGSGDPLAPAGPSTPAPQPVHSLPKNSKRDLMVIGIALAVLVVVIILAIVLRRH